MQFMTHLTEHRPIVQLNKEFINLKKKLKKSEIWLNKTISSFYCRLLKAWKILHKIIIDYFYDAFCHFGAAQYFTFIILTKEPKRFFRNFTFVFHRIKKGYIQVYTDMRASKWMVNFPYKCSIKQKHSLKIDLGTLPKNMTHAFALKHLVPY